MEEERDNFMERVDQQEPEHPDEIPDNRIFYWISLAVLVIFMDVLVLIILSNTCHNKITFFFIATAIIMLSIAILLEASNRILKSPRNVRPTGFPRIQPPADQNRIRMVVRPRRSQRLAKKRRQSGTDIEPAYESSSAHLMNPDFPGTSGSHPPELHVSRQHLGPEATQPEPPQAEEQSLQAEASGETSAARKILQIASSVSQIALRSVTTMVNVDTQTERSGTRYLLSRELEDDTAIRQRKPTPELCHSSSED